MLTAYLLRDHLGNITHQVNTSNTVVAEYSFDAWGRRRNPADWSYNLASQPALFADRGFTGHEFLSWFNLYNMNGRLYDPLVGRFLSVDNVIQDPTSTQNFNRYSYCLNNPLRYNDPSGWLMAALDEYWNLGKETTNFDRFYGFSPSGSRENGGGGGGYTSSGPGGNAYSNSFWNNVLNQGDQILNDQSSGENSQIASRSHNKYGVEGLWVQTVNFTGDHHGWRDGINDPTSEMNVINKFTPDNSNSGGSNGRLNTWNTINTWAGTGTFATGKALSATRLGSNIAYQLAYSGLGNATKYLQPVGVGTSIVGAGIGLFKFNGTENKTWGVYGQLGISLLSSGLTLSGVTAPVGIGLGTIDAYGGFNGFYNYLDNQQQFYNSTGGVIMPINGIPYYYQLNWK